MDFSWSDEQLEFKQSVIKFAKNELNNANIEWDHDCLFEKKLWQKCARFGIQGLCIPEEYGEQGRYVFTTILVL